MADLSLERRFRLLHSWRAKTTRLFEGESPDNRKTKAAFRKAVQWAEAELELARRTEHKHLEALAGALRERLDALSASGTIRLDAPAPATEDDYPHLGDVEAIRSEIARYNVVLSAESADALGGFLDLPIDEYPVALGLRRSGTPATSRFASTPKRIAIAAALSAVFGVLGTLLYLQSAQTIQVIISQPQDGIVSFQLENRSTDTLAFWIPFDKQVPDLENALKHCGIQVLGQSPNDDAPRLLPIEPEHWQVPGALGNPTLPLSIGPGLSQSLEIDLQVIRRDYGPFDRMVLRCVQRNGKILGEAVYNLPSPS